MILVPSLILQTLSDVSGQVTGPQKTLTKTFQNRIKRDHQLKATTSVISHEFRLTEENLSQIKEKVDLHTFAELQEDPKASFPPVFTICSTIMTTSSKDTSSLFFTILGKDGNNYLTANLNGDMISLGLGLGSGNIALVPEKRIVRV